MNSHKFTCSTKRKMKRKKKKWTHRNEMNEWKIGFDQNSSIHFWTIVSSWRKTTDRFKSMHDFYYHKQSHWLIPEWTFSLIDGSRTITSVVQLKRPHEKYRRKSARHTNERYKKRKKKTIRIHERYFNHQFFKLIAFNLEFIHRNEESNVVKMRYFACYYMMSRQSNTN